MLSNSRVNEYRYQKSTKYMLFSVIPVAGMRNLHMLQIDTVYVCMHVLIQEEEQSSVVQALQTKPSGVVTVSPPMTPPVFTCLMSPANERASLSQRNVMFHLIMIILHFLLLEAQRSAKDNLDLPGARFVPFCESVCHVPCDHFQSIAYPNTRQIAKRPCKNYQTRYPHPQVVILTSTPENGPSPDPQTGGSVADYPIPKHFPCLLQKYLGPREI